MNIADAVSTKSYRAGWKSVGGENTVHFLNHFCILQAELEFNPAGSLGILDAVDINQIGITAAFGGEDLLELLFL